MAVCVCSSGLAEVLGSVAALVKSRQAASAAQEMWSLLRGTCDRPLGMENYQCGTRLSFFVLFRLILRSKSSVCGSKSQLLFDRLASCLREASESDGHDRRARGGIVNRPADHKAAGWIDDHF